MNDDILRAQTMFKQRCETLGLACSDQHLAVLNGILTTYGQMAGKSEAEILAMYETGEITEGRAAFWLGIDRLTLREKIHGGSTNPG